jgi:hypothetical protein
VVDNVNCKDLEHDHTKLNRTEIAAEPRFVKNKPGNNKIFKRKTEIVSKPAPKKIETKADAGVIDKKLDDILADL